MFPIEITPLRDRAEDIAPLVAEFIRRIEAEQSVSLRISDEAMSLIRNYEFPGNVRELANLIERLVVIRPNGFVTATDLPWPIAPDSTPTDDSPEVLSAELSAVASLPPEGIDLKQYLATIEQEMIHNALEESGGVVQRAAELLGIGRTTLVEKIRRYNLR